jgi:hypothetical protein
MDAPAARGRSIPMLAHVAVCVVAIVCAMDMGLPRDKVSAALARHDSNIQLSYVN